MKFFSRRLRFILLTLVPVVAFVACFGWLTWRQYERVRLRGPLVDGVRAKDADQVKELLDRGADPNARDTPPTGPTSLSELFLTLLGRDPAAQRNKGETVLMLAVENEDLCCVELLLSRGADINATDEDHNTALMDSLGVGCIITKVGNSFIDSERSCLLGQPHDCQVLKVLLDRGADVNAKHIDGNTALSLANLSQNKEAIALLKQYGAKE